MKLLVVGTGYVGLVTGTCFAEMGHHVICLDVDEHKINQLRDGVIPIYEPGLQEMVRRNAAEGRLEFTTDYAKAVQSAQFCFIAVGTPQSVSGEADLSGVRQAAASIADHLTRDMIVVIKSTVPVGTGKMAREILLKRLEERGVSYQIDMVSNPEFLKEGDAVNDCIKPDRVIIGSDNPTAAERVKELYKPFTLNHDRILLMDAASAELTKYAANAMLASRISFMNELSGLCEKVGADVNWVRKGIGSDRRLGYQFLYPGVGFGGSCFPKDIRALLAQAGDANYEMPLINAVELVNMRQKRVLGAKILSYFGTRGGLEDKTIAILGVAFKPNTDDVREAPAQTLVEQLLEAGAKVRLYDPVAMENAQRTFPKGAAVHWAQDEQDAATGADAIALVTEWRQFRFLDFPALKKVMNGTALFDGRNQYRPSDVVVHGFDYFGIGLSPQRGADTEALTEADTLPLGDEVPSTTRN